jgi:hypothetical protein
MGPRKVCSYEPDFAMLAQPDWMSAGAVNASDSEKYTQNIAQKKIASRS